MFYFNNSIQKDILFRWWSPEKSQPSHLKTCRVQILLFDIFIKQVMEAKGIAIEDIKSFLDYLQGAYEGIDEKARKKMEGILLSVEWADKVVDFKCKSSRYDAMYGMIAFGKSRDGKFVDCMYCIYKLDFKVAPRIITTQPSWLGLLTGQTVEEQEKKRSLYVKSLKRIQNFFRFKALEGFYKEGLIDKINVVPSIEDVADDE